ncbi:galactokinase [Paenibacillus turpanensis]|uniref:galactokinase n=1 Tax=Paenibacillus turpanensis TaxID=2689078 RepID=UPI00140B99C2|nr:galactokinase [Paenibacillus turpanensis]
MEQHHLEQLRRQFIDRFGGELADIRAYHSPGRVNLIGEHTDYNGGSVFPAALTFGTTMLLRQRDDRTVRFASLNFPEQSEVDIDRLFYDKQDAWANYPKGVLKVLQEQGYELGGFDILYWGNIPNGAGLSSSASIEVVTGYGVLSASGHTVDRVQLSLLCQKAENEFVGVNCGIMDQFAVANGKQRHAILLQCNTLEHELVPFHAPGYKLVIGNTNKKRGLVDSEYNARRSQCEEAVACLRRAFPDLTLLGKLTPQQYEEHEQLLTSEVLKKRARHVIEEIDRTKRGVEALRSGDLKEFGRLMNGSHDSLRDLYEVTGPQLDAMVEEARRVAGVLGSRMTGAGFGGCTVSLVEQGSVDAFIETVGSRYTQRTGLAPEFYVSEIGDGVRELL